MQAGSVYALDPGCDSISPSYRESAIGLLRGMPASTRALLVARPPGGLVEPGGLQRGLDPACRSGRRAARRGPRLGQAAARRERVRDRVLRGQCATIPRARSIRAPTSPRSCARRSCCFCNSNGLGDLDAGRGADRAENLVDKAVGYGMRAARVGLDILSVYDRRASRLRAPGRETAHFIEAVSYRAVPHATAERIRRRTSTWSVSRERKRGVRGARSEVFLRCAGILTGPESPSHPRRGPSRLMA